MRRMSLSGVLFAVLLCIPVQRMVAAPLAIFSTGMDASGHSLSPGAIDPHYMLVSVNPGTGGPSAFVPTGASPAEVAQNSTLGIPLNWPLNSWATDLPDQWISPQSDVVGIPDYFPPNGDFSYPNGVYYTYQTTFSLNGFVPGTAQLSGHFAADNYVYSYSLNGGSPVIVPPLTPNPCGQPGSFAFANMDPFSITSGFTAGANTLTFTVINSTCYDTKGAPNPTGLLVDISGTATPVLGNPNVPEPGTTYPAAFGLVFAAFLYRRRRQ